MPNFNYDNATNVLGGGMLSPQEKLLEAARNVIVYQGFSSLNLETLGEATGLSEELKQYEDSFDLCEAVLQDAAEKIRLSYAPMTEPAVEYIQSRSYQRDESIKQLERLLYRHIHLCFHPKNRSYVLLAGLEAQLPKELKRVLPDAIEESFTAILSQLILLVSEVKNAQKASLLAASICGSIQIFLQQPELCQAIFLQETRNEPNYAVIEDFLNDMFLRDVVVNTSMNKAF